MSDEGILRAVLIAAVFFAVTLGMGVLAVNQDPVVGEEVLKILQEEIFGQITDENPFSVAIKIFLNNLEACLILFIGGAAFGILTLLVLGMNGLLIGAVIELVRQQEGVVFVAAAIVPHGIFEVPAFILASAFGLLLADALFRELQGTADAAEKAFLLGRQFLTFVVPLLLVAAFTEAFITPEIVNLVII
jgi:stage II sporulation protein M